MTGPATAPDLARGGLRHRIAALVTRLLDDGSPRSRRRRHSTVPGADPGPGHGPASVLGPDIERIPRPDATNTANRADPSGEKPSMTLTAPIPVAPLPTAPAPAAPTADQGVRDAPGTARGGAARRGAALLRVAAVVVVLGFLLAQVGHEPVVAALSSITVPILIAALGLGLVTTVAAALRWCVVARGVGLQLGLGRATADVYRATFLNSVLPAGVLGDVHRAVTHGAAGARGARAVVMERVAGQLVIVLAAVGVLLASPELLATASGGLVGAGAVLGVVVGLLALAVLFVTFARGAWAVRVRAGLASTVVDLRNGLFSARAWPAVVALSLVAFGGFLALFVVAARTAGVGPELASIPQLLPLLVLGLLAMAIPIGVGGWGPREATSIVAFAAVGLGAELGLAVAVVYGVLSLVSCLPGLLVLLLARRRLPVRSLGR